MGLHRRLLSRPFARREQSAPAPLSSLRCDLCAQPLFDGPFRAELSSESPTFVHLACERREAVERLRRSSTDDAARRRSA